MGSFDYTCAISGLPIGGGTPVRFFLLQSSPYSPGGNYADGDLVWYLRAPPIRAKYSDYGSVRDVHPDDVPIANLWLDGLQIDLLEKGVGDNTYHDPAARKSMSIEEMIEALRACRLEVRPKLETKEQRIAYEKEMGRYTSKQKIARGIPTLRRVEKVISGAGSIEYTIDASNIVRGPGGPYQFTPSEYASFDPRNPHFGGTRIEGREAETYSLNISALGNTQHSFIVDELQKGEIRVRVGGMPSDIESRLRLYGLVKKLQKRYSAMVSPGEYGYGELLIHPKPGTKCSDGDAFSFHAKYARQAEAEPQKLLLRHAMVREDVWQGLCKFSVEGWTPKMKGKVMRKLGAFRVSARSTWNAFRKLWAKCKKEEADWNARYEKNTRSSDPLNPRFFYGEWKDWCFKHHNPVGFLTHENPSISGFGFDTSWKLMTLREDLSQGQIDNFLSVVAETALVSDVLGTVRFVWHPGTCCRGPQFGAWKEHEKFIEMLLKCTRKKVAEIKKREEEFEARMEAHRREEQAKEG